MPLPVKFRFERGTVSFFIFQNDRHEQHTQRRNVGGRERERERESFQFHRSGEKQSNIEARIAHVGQRRHDLDHMI